MLEKSILSKDVSLLAVFSNSLLSLMQQLQPCVLLDAVVLVKAAAAALDGVESPDKPQVKVLLMFVAAPTYHTQ